MFYRLSCILNSNVEEDERRVEDENPENVSYDVTYPEHFIDEGNLFTFTGEELIWGPSTSSGPSIAETIDATGTSPVPKMNPSYSSSVFDSVISKFLRSSSQKNEKSIGVLRQPLKSSLVSSLTTGTAAGAESLSEITPQELKLPEASAPSHNVDDDFMDLLDEELNNCDSNTSLIHLDDKALLEQINNGIILNLPLLPMPIQPSAVPVFPSSIERGTVKSESHVSESSDNIDKESLRFENNY